MLLNSFKTNALHLSSRLVMAPITRCKATADQVPTEEMALYYAARASAGLLITEATCVSACANAYPNTPGLYNEAQIAGWQRITEGVHVAGGKIFVQLWHAGMMGHSHFLQGALPIAPSTVRPLREKVPRSELIYETPRPMEKSDFAFVIEQFAEAARKAHAAGFDGVELHGAGGYLLDSFLHHHTNRREDLYGEEKERFVLEVFDAVSAEITTGIRLSPKPLQGMENMLADSRDDAVFERLLKALEKRSTAYVHLASDQETRDALIAMMRAQFAGTLIGCGSFTVEEAHAALANSACDLVAFGRLMVANPRMVDLLKRGESLHPFDFSMVSEPPTGSSKV